MWFHVGCVCHLHLNPVCLTETLCIVIKLTCCLYPLENMYSFMKHVAPKHALPETERGTVQFWGCHLEMLIWHVSTLLSWKCFVLGGSACRQYGCTSAEVWWDGKKKKNTTLQMSVCCLCEICSSSTFLPCSTESGSLQSYVHIFRYIFYGLWIIVNNI